MDYTLLKDIIRYAEAFQKQDPSGGIQEFTLWLNTMLFVSQQDDSHAPHDSLLIGFKVLQAGKGLKRQAKSVLLESSLTSLDEYSFLLHLDFQDSFRKMELVELHKLEAATGIEIIKRLLKHGFVREFSDPDDRRAKRIQITPAGRKVLNEIRPKIDAVFAHFAAPLSLNEKVQISGLLDKL